jgi:hypothetical protein
MKLVESEFEHSIDDDDAERPVPPRPEHRRVYVSLIVTLSVLIATVVLVYAVFPKRDNELLDAAIEAHLDPREAELTRPSRAELDAWTVGVLGRGVPWPEIDAPVIDAFSFVVVRSKATLVRYRIGGDLVSLAVTLVRAAPPRIHRRTKNGLYAVSWRRERWTFVAVGPIDHADQWTEMLGAPR